MLGRANLVAGSGGPREPIRRRIDDHLKSTLGKKAPEKPPKKTPPKKTADGAPPGGWSPVPSSAEIKKWQDKFADYNLRHDQEFAPIDTMVGYVDGSDKVATELLEKAEYSAQEEADFEDAYFQVASLEQHDPKFAEYIKSPEIKKQVAETNAKAKEARKNAPAGWRGMSLEHVLKIAIAGKTVEKTSRFLYGDSITHDFNTAQDFQDMLDSVIVQFNKRSLEGNSVDTEYDNLSCLISTEKDAIKKSLGAQWAYMTESRIPVGTAVWTPKNPDPKALKIDRIYIRSRDKKYMKPEDVKKAAALLGAEVEYLG